ncbi:uncharacterized protein [Palaemon carinicauda]|uniref:uncharacterized protein n=1 Tax=Palaemon carinicauda TaxID=392227 RepID=UPI0035B5BF24
MILIVFTLILIIAAYRLYHYLTAFFVLSIFLRLINLENQVSNNFGENQGSNNFGENQVSNNFGENQVSNNFGENQVSNNFGENLVSNNFGENLVSNNVGENLVSNNVGQNQVNNNVGQNQVNNNFEENQVSNNFEQDQVSNNFEQNQVSNNFEENQVNNNFEENQNSGGDVQNARGLLVWIIGISPIEKGGGGGEEEEEEEEEKKKKKKKNKKKNKKKKKKKTEIGTDWSTARISLTLFKRFTLDGTSPKSGERDRVEGLFSTWLGSSSSRRTLQNQTIVLWSWVVSKPLYHGLPLSQAPRSTLKTLPKHTDVPQVSQEDTCRRRHHLSTRGTSQSKRTIDRVNPTTSRLDCPKEPTAFAAGIRDSNAPWEESQSAERSVENPLTSMPCLEAPESATSSTSTPLAKSPMRIHRRRKAGATFRLPKMALPKMLLPTVCFCFLILVGLMVTPCEALCPETCTCDDVALVVRCEPSATLDVLPLTFNPGLQQLTMYGTDIHTLDINSMMWYVDLRHVNLSKNMIMRVMPETFKNQAHLEELHLAQNNISELESEMFMGLSNLIVLTLRGNIIEYLDAGVFVHLKQLKDLDLSENRLQSIEDNALEGLDNLRVLHLHDNRLATIPSQNLALVPDLAYLSLGGNEFFEVNEYDLGSLKTLKDLNLSGAQLGDGLTVDSFKGLSGLTKLMLEDCGLEEVPTAALSPLIKLEELHIGRNLFTSLPPNAFSYNRHLSALYISGCPELTYINKDFLHSNVNIRTVVISQNPHLTYIDEDAFQFLSELSLLNLHGNNIQTLSENVASWKDIEKWSLVGNPIACNCSAAWLREHIISLNSSLSLRCVSPPGLSGTTLASTQMTDLACGMDPAIKGLVIGLVVTVVVVVAIVVVLLYRHHGSCVHRLLKGHRLDRHGGTFGHHSCSHDNYQGYIMTPQKPVPVTEL